MADIDELKFSIILDDSKFTKKMKEVEELAGKFEKSVKEALAITNLLDSAQNKGAKATKQKAQVQKEVVLLTRQELEAKKAAGTITKQELQQLKQIILVEKALLDEENKKLNAQKKQLDIENKTLTIKKKKEDAERRHAAAVESTNEKVRKQSLLMQQVTSYIGTYLSIYGGISLVRNIVRITGEFEAQRAALRAILQDAAGADRIFYQLQELAVKSPYTFRDLTSYAKQLSAFSVPMNEIYDTTKKLADVSAGLGVDMSRIILAYGQVRSAAFLRGQEVRQFTEAGIPILAELAKQFEEIEGHAVSTGEVFDRISKRQVPFEMVEEAFRRMTAEGGKFYNMQEVLAATVKGKISNLQDSWEIMLSKIGDANSGLIKGSLSLLTELIKNYEKLGAVIIEVTVAYGAYKATLAATNALQSAAAVSTRFLAVAGERVTSLEVLAHRLFRTTESGLAKIGKFIAKNPYAIAIAAVAAGITGLILHLRKMNEHLRETDKITAKAIGQAEASKSNIHYYIQRLKEAKEGTEEYNKARQAVIDQAGNYISATDAERLSLQNVDDVWVNICKHIEEATKLQAMQSVTADAAARKQAAQLQAMDDLASYQLSNSLTNETRMDIASFIRGEIDKDTLRERLLAAGIFNPTYNYRGQEYEIISKGSLADVVSHAETWALAYAEAEGIYNESIQRAQQNMNDLYAFVGPQPPEEKKALEGWRARVKEFIDTVNGGDRGMKIDDATSLSSYIKKGAEALNAARDALKHTPKDDADYAKLEKEIEFYETISEKIYGAGNTEFDNTTKKFKKDAKDAKELRREKIEDLKQAFQDLKELKTHYDKLKSLGVSDDVINGYFLEFFGRGIPTGGFKSAFESIAAELEGLNDANTARDVKNYAAGRDLNQIEERLKAEKKAAEEAEKALNKYLDALEEWTNATQELSGTGAAYGISKAIAKYKKTIGKNEDNFWKTSVLATNAYKKNPAKQAGAVGNLMSLWAKNRVSALGTLREDVLKYTDEVFKEEMNKRGFDLTNLNDKNLSQLLAIKKAIESIEVPQEVRDMLNASPEGVELLKQLEKAIEEYKKNYNDNTLGPETFKKVAKGAKYAASQILSLAESVGKLSTEAGESIEILSDFLSTVAQGFAQGGPYGIVIGAVAWMAKKVIGLIAEEVEATAEFERTSAKAIAAYNEAMNSISVKRKDTIFGENTIGKAREYIRIAKEYKDKFEPTIKALSKFSFGEDYIDEKGLMNVERFLADLENGVITGDATDDLKNAIEKYKDALEQVDSIAKNIFGDIASSSADKIVEGWIEAGNAALDYADILDDVAKAYSKMLIQSMISETFLDPITEDVKKAFIENRYEDAMAMIAGAMEGISDSAPMFEEILRAFNPYFNTEEDDSGESLGAGIKSVTEDTANLLASYINAIRADVSYGRIQWERIAVAVEGQAGQYITLNDYMAQVAANTFDTAQNTQRILGELQSVIGAEGSSGSIVRVQMA